MRALCSTIPLTLVPRPRVASRHFNDVTISGQRSASHRAIKWHVKTHYIHLFKRTQNTLACCIHSRESYKIPVLDMTRLEDVDKVTE